MPGTGSAGVVEERSVSLPGPFNVSNPAQEAVLQGRHLPSTRLREHLPVQIPGRLAIT
jgi:hypothetical protein